MNKNHQNNNKVKDSNTNHDNDSIFILEQQSNKINLVTTRKKKKKIDQSKPPTQATHKHTTTDRHPYTHSHKWFSSESVWIKSKSLRPKISMYATHTQYEVKQVYNF